MSRFALCLFLLLTLIGAGVDASAQLVERRVAVYSEGTRLAGYVLHPPTPQGGKLPTIVMSHGWGGTAAMLRPDAERFAREGFFVLVIDYRGWGDSDGRWVRDEASATGPETRRELREVVDPLDQAADIFSAVHWVMGEPLVDTDRVGLWGSSFAGGLVTYVAARDPRIKAIVAQVGAFGRPRSALTPEVLARAQSDATRRARGEIGYPAPGVREIGNLRGAPIRESFLRYAPIDDIPAIKGCAMLVIDAEKEELFDLREHGALAFERAAEPKKRVVIPGISHYGIYGTAHEQSIGLAVDWMNEHLKGASRSGALR